MEIKYFLNWFGGIPEGSFRRNPHQKGRKQAGKDGRPVDHLQGSNGHVCCMALDGRTTGGLWKRDQEG